MKRKLICIIILLLFITASITKREAIANFSNLPEVAVMNIEALSIGPNDIGRICWDGCHITGDPYDFCTQCLQSTCLDYFMREPIGSSGNCP